MFGFFNIDKPLGMTSHDVVARVRRHIGLKQVGHAGTLDPLASGVLVICVGGATRLSDYIMHGTKTYRALIRFGITTTTYDAEGEIIRQVPVDHLTREEFEDELGHFMGVIEQVPPMYSAIKQNGRKLYELARQGMEVERPARRVTIYDLTLAAWNPPEAVLEIRCSAGTYIRSLAYDLGERLGVGAHLSGLVRTASGTFTLEDAVSLSQVCESPNPAFYLIPPEKALREYPRVDCSLSEEDDLRHGRSIPASDHTDEQTVMGYNHAGLLFAVLERRGNRWHPSKVFHDRGGTG